MLLRSALVVAHLAWGLALAAWLKVTGAAPATRARLAQAWHRRLLGILGIHLHVRGTPLRGAHLTAANHVSWLDIPVIGALEPACFISKSEVRDWPLAGTLARAAGTFFLRRGSGAVPLLEKLVRHLRHHGTVVLFPEGTTTDGSLVGRFHARLFDAAIEARCPVQPLTLQYGFALDGTNVAPFVGDTSLVAHVLRILRQPGLQVLVQYGPPVAPTVPCEALAQEAECYVRAALQPMPTVRRAQAGRCFDLQADNDGARSAGQRTAPDRPSDAVVSTSAR